MTHYTIIADSPSGDIKPRLEQTKTFHKNANGQWILWDGIGNEKDIIAMCFSLFPYFKKLQAFEGKDAGQQIFADGRATEPLARCFNCNVEVTRRTLKRGYCKDCIKTEK